MKIKSFFSVVLFATFLFYFSSCSSSDDSNANSNSQSSNLGVFAGNFQVSDDPQTNLGYVFNAKVSVSISGSNATIRITGDNNFDREFIGTVSGTSGNSTLINISKQTKPVEKNAGSTLVIQGNELTFQISLANDAVIVKKATTSTTTVEITGKIQMIGTSMLKE